MPNENYLGTVYADDRRAISGTEVYLQQTKKIWPIIVGDFVIVQDPIGVEYFASISEIDESPLYTRNPDSIIFLSRQLESSEGGLQLLEKLPEAKKETKVIARARIHKTKQNSQVVGPGVRPSPVSLFREPSALEIEEFLNVPKEGFPLILVRSDGTARIDSQGNHAFARIDPKAPLTGMLTVGSPGSGKTMLNGAMAWWYAKNGWAVVLINNKADDLLYLDEPAPYTDDVWQDLGWSPSGVKKLQVVFPIVNGCSRGEGPLIPFSFDPMALRPESLTGLIDFSERGVMQLPHLFRDWQQGSGGTIFDFIDYLESGNRQGMYVTYQVQIQGRRIPLRVHASTVDSAVSVLQSYSNYFGGGGRILSPDQIIKPGMVTVFDLSRADPVVSKLLIQHYLHQIRAYQRASLTDLENEDKLVPTLFEVDEAHQFFKRYSNDEMSRTIEHELETHIKLSRSLKVATVLSSQLGSELHPAANRLATVKMILRSDRTEIKSLGLPLSDSEVAAVESFSPGRAQLRDGFRIRIPLFVKVPMSPAHVRGQT
jgi:hypothetical protein